MEGQSPFGSLLKRYRLSAGLTHEVLAERAALSARAISDLERGISRRPRAETLALLIGALRLPPEDRAALEAAARRHPEPDTASPDRARPQSNLPAQLTSFVGRERELHAVGELLRRDNVRLLTLTGTGGAGKTRLAIRAAEDLRHAFRDGVLYVPLAPIVDPERMAQAVARAIDTPDADHHAAFAQVCRHLRDTELLLLLDNFEHLLPAAPRLVELLRVCPRVKLLVTSRAVLRLSCEYEFVVTPLPLPDTSHPWVDVLARNPAVALFVDRARQVNPRFTLTADAASSIAVICARLDGLPLAIELAAARMKHLSPSALLARFGQGSEGSSLRLLTGGARDAPVRHRTLRDTITWSYNLLPPEERRLFRRLAVFAGGCTLEAAEAVCQLTSAPGEVTGAVNVDLLDQLASLVDKSLLYRDDGPEGEPRFMMLETIRQFALERLIAHGEEVALRGQHARYYLAMVEATGALLFAAARARARASAEQDNIQAALHWLVQSG